MLRLNSHFLDFHVRGYCPPLLRGFAQNFGGSSGEPALAAPAAPVAARLARLTHSRVPVRRGVRSG